MIAQFSDKKQDTGSRGPGYEKSTYYFIKSLVFLGFFSLVHFIYELWPNGFTLFIGAADESVFGHTKMAFYAWLLVFIIELAVFMPRKLIENKKPFVLSRLFVATLLPWFEMLVWYIEPAIAKADTPLSIELTWSLAVVYIIGLLGGGIERKLQKIDFDMYSMIVVLALFVLSIIFFTVFTWEKPWIDYFYLS